MDSRKISTKSAIRKFLNKENCVFLKPANGIQIPYGEIEWLSKEQILITGF